MSKARTINLARNAITLMAVLLSVTYSIGQTHKDSLIVFVGEIIEVKYSPEEKKQGLPDTVIRNGKKVIEETITISIDSRYLARYKVLQLVYGTYKEDTIEFIVYDHYGQPGFSKYKTVLLFVSKLKGKLYHEKYQYFDVYKTTDNRWASPGDPYKFDSYHKKELKPQKIKFKENVFYDLQQYDKDRIKSLFPQEYYRISRKKAYPLVGTYIEDLFTVKKEGVLKARGIF